MGPMTQPNRLPLPGLKPKDLIGIPWRVAFALQADGWWLRSAITWCKAAPMPESVCDRPTNATEMVFLLTKSGRYFYDQEAERIPYALDSVARVDRGRSTEHKWADGGPGGQTLVADTASACTHVAGRNLWNYWVLSPEAFAEAHFATMPTELARRCIRLGTSDKGCCVACGAPWLRVVERQQRTDGRATMGARERNRGDRRDGFTKAPSGLTIAATTRGWQPSCICGAEAVPCKVLDPFAGAGTTGMIARRLGRDFIGIELNASYCDLARRRIRDDAPLLNTHTEALT